jgi:hypothetical protein
MSTLSVVDEVVRTPSGYSIVRNLKLAVISPDHLPVYNCRKCDETLYIANRFRKELFDE